MPSYRVSTSTATAASTSTTTTSNGTSEVSQPELAARQCSQSYFAGIPIVVHTPDSTHMPAADQQGAGLSCWLKSASHKYSLTLSKHLLHTKLSLSILMILHHHLTSHRSRSKVMAPIVREEPCEVTLFISLPTNGRETNTRTTTSIPKQEILPSNHFRRALSGTAPEALQTAIAKEPKLLTGAYIAMAIPDTDTTTEKWIMWTGNEEKPFKCGYPQCKKSYKKTIHLKAHFLKHTHVSNFKSTYPEYWQVFSSSRWSEPAHSRNTHLKDLTNVKSVISDLSVKIVWSPIEKMCMSLKMRKNHRNERENNQKLRNFYMND